MPKILATRIDERLVHGQVQMWIKSLGCNLVVVANDEVSQDKLAQTLMQTTVPKDIGMRFFSIQHTCDVIHKAADHQKIYLVVKTIGDVKKLVDGGVPIKYINIGNIHNSEGKEMIANYIYLNEQEKINLKSFIHSGIEINAQKTPITAANDVDFEAIL